MKTPIRVSGPEPGSGCTSSDSNEDADEPPAQPPKPDDCLARQVGLRRPSSTSPRFPTTPRSQTFRKRFFPKATAAEWSNWRWQLQHRIRDGAELGRIFQLAPQEHAALTRSNPFPIGITPYFASLMDRADPRDPMRRTHVPVVDELQRTPAETEDPLSEGGHTVVPGVVHRYPDRVLFLVSSFCSTHCRYCTRTRIVGRPERNGSLQKRWECALQYVEAHPQVRDVLLSGGDPLTLSDQRLTWLLDRLRRIPHVELIRIGTKVPVVLPMRITRQLVHVLRRHHPLWMSIHFTHPEELTPEVREACARLADAGIPLGSQTVLLRGINDDVGTMKALVHGLLKLRVRPYYLYQCDPIQGSSHFRTPVSKGLEILSGLRGHTSGYAVPTYVIDAPGGGGKVPLLPDSVVGSDRAGLLLRNFENRVFTYPDEGLGLNGDEGTALERVL